MAGVQMESKRSTQRHSRLVLSKTTWESRVKTRLSLVKEILKSAFWITPTVTTLALLALLFIVREIDKTLPADQLLLLKDESVHSSRLVLSSIATAVMTVVDVIFSVTVLVLQQVSQQYTPRVIENVIRSTSNQFVLGFYIGTFGYSLLLLAAGGKTAARRSDRYGRQD